MTVTVGAYEAKTHLPRLLDQVEAGEDIVITRHGRPVARLVAVEDGADRERETRETWAMLTAIRASTRPGPSVREMIDEGRR